MYLVRALSGESYELGEHWPFPLPFPEDSSGVDCEVSQAKGMFVIKTEQLLCSFFT